MDLPDSPKLALFDGPEHGWAYVTALCHAGRTESDGVFPVARVLRLAGVSQGVADDLAEVGLWHLPGHDCPRCPQPPSGCAYVHDYLRHQRSADAARRAREAGRKAAATRWSHADRNANPMRTALPAACDPQCEPQCDFHANRNAEVEVEEEKKKTSSSSGRGRKRPAAPLPEAWMPNPGHVSYAQEHQIDMENEAAKFQDHAKSKDLRYVDWDAAFRTWLRNQVTWAKQRSPTRQEPRLWEQ